MRIQLGLNHDWCYLNLIGMSPTMERRHRQTEYYTDMIFKLGTRRSNKVASFSKYTAE